MFSYQVTGVRDGFEKQDVVVDEKKLDSPSLVREDVQRRIDAYLVKARAEKARELENRKK